MKIVMITASHGLTVNLGNFNSARFEFSAEAEVEEKENAVDASKKLREFVAERIAEQVKEFEKKPEV